LIDPDNVCPDVTSGRLECLLQVLEYITRLELEVVVIVGVSTVAAGLGRQARDEV
jgi:hypothetical protein